MWEEILIAILACFMAIMVFAALHPIVFGLLAGSMLGTVAKIAHIYFVR